MKYLLIAFILSLFSLSPLLPTATVFAQQTSLSNLTSGPFPSSSVNSGISQNNSTSGLNNPLKVNSLQELLTTILSFVVKIGTIVVVIMLIYTGFEFVMSQGNSVKIQKARTMLIWTIVGALIILGAQAISLGVSATVTSISAGT